MVQQQGSAYGILRGLGERHRVDVYFSRCGAWYVRLSAVIASSSQYDSVAIQQ